MTETGIDHTVWQVKVSTLCNLRCRYCYEWDRLGDKRRLTLDQWRNVFEAAAEYRQIRFERNGIEARTVFAWHGGEATLLPKSYVEQVLDLQVQILGQKPLDDGLFANAVQTNLYRRNETLNLMIASGFLLSVSLDFKSGARVDGAANDAEPHVMGNLETLLGEGVTCGVALVLGRHNHLDLIEIHDHLEKIGAEWLNIIPIIEPPDKAPSGNLQLTTEEVLEALTSLMAYRHNQGTTLSVSPVDRAWRTAKNHARSENAQFQRDRARFGETRMIVHPDGKLAVQAGSTEPDRVLGNIFKTAMNEIVDGSEYHASIDDDARKRQNHCAFCNYDKACDKRALFDVRLGLKQGPCKIEAKLCDFAEQLIL